jgi:hypothetical protein
MFTMNFKLLIAVFALLFTASCEKDTATTTQTVKTPEELLTARTWKAEEIRVQQSNNVFVFYNRGGASNTANFDGDSLRFNTNNTGVYYSLGSQTTTTWNFTNAEKTKMALKINYATPLNINVENIALSENAFYFSQYYVYAGISYAAYGKRSPN